MKDSEKVARQLANHLDWDIPSEQYNEVRESLEAAYQKGRLSVVGNADGVIPLEAWVEQKKLTQVWKDWVNHFEAFDIYPEDAEDLARLCMTSLRPVLGE